MSPRTPPRRALAALSLFGCACLAFAACTGDDGASGGTTTTSASTPSAACETGTEALCVSAFSDPSQIVQVDVGRRFAIAMRADPANGWRWVVDPIDTALLAPLGSSFTDDPALLASATTTTAPPPLPEDLPAPGPLDPDAEVTTTAEPLPSTTTTAPGPLVQVISYAGRAAGFTQITMRYQRIGTSEDDVEQAETVTFQVWVGPIPSFESPPEEEPPPA